MKYAITLTVDDEVQWVGSTRSREPWMSKTSTDAALFVQKKTAEAAAKDIAKSMWGQRATEISVVGVEFTIAEIHPISLVTQTGFVVVAVGYNGAEFLYTGTKKSGTYSQLGSFDSISPGRATTFTTFEQADKRRAELLTEAEVNLEKEKAGTTRNRDVFVKSADERLKQMNTARVIDLADYMGDVDE